jgi:uncharacterized protein DUF6300
VVVLCPRCDADEPKAGAVITFFHVHGQVDAITVHQCGDLLRAWVASITIPPVDTAAVDAEHEAWRRGEL